MVALYALGIMSVTWMVVVTVLIAGERLVARPSIAVAAVAAVLVVLGVGIAAAPASVPGLTIPRGRAIRPRMGMDMASRSTVTSSGVPRVISVQTHSFDVTGGARDGTD